MRNEFLLKTRKNEEDWEEETKCPKNFVHPQVPCGGDNARLLDATSH